MLTDCVIAHIFQATSMEYKTKNCKNNQILTTYVLENINSLAHKLNMSHFEPSNAALQLTPNVDKSCVC